VIATQAPPKIPSRRKKGRVTAVVLVIAAAVAAGIVVSRGSGTTKPSAAAGPTTGVAQVTKGTLSARSLENGTLGYAGTYPVIGKATGTVTRLPAVGQLVNQGTVLYRVDGKPVILLRGASVPVYRDLTRGVEGSDVRQLNAALVTLGYATKDEIDPDSTYFGWQTYYALKELQDAVGAEETGGLALGQAVFLPAGQIRVTKVNAVRGGSVMAGGTVLEASSTARQVTVALNATRQAEVAVGDKVDITLPSGQTTPGVVSAVGKVATKTETNTNITVNIRPMKPKETGRLDQAPVQVSIVTDTAKDVLSVPVNALLALGGGGYAVEVAGTHALITVRTGLFDDSEGTVEVTGDGLTEGQNVVVPAS
jgi:hypothetical protein